MCFISVIALSDVILIVYEITPMAMPIFILHMLRAIINHGLLLKQSFELLMSHKYVGKMWIPSYFVVFYIEEMAFNSVTIIITELDW